MRISVAALLCALAVLLCGCVFRGTQESSPTSSSTTGSSFSSSSSAIAQQQAATPTVELLQGIWNGVPEQERFAVYGGSMANALMDAPGPLELSDEALLSNFLFPGEFLPAAREAASLVHMMNSNIFTAVAVEVAEPAQIHGLFAAWRERVQSNQWVCGQPERLVFAQIGQERLLMFFGNADVTALFADAMQRAQPQAQVLYSEAVVS